MLTLKKNEHLCSKMLINDLFTKGNQFFCYPFKILWQNRDNLPCSVTAQILISIPKKNISSAVDRNKLKRRIREAYRKNKTEYILYLKTTAKYNIIAFTYIEKKIISYQEIEKKITLILQFLQKENEKNNC